MIVIIPPTSQIGGKLASDLLEALAAREATIHASVARFRQPCKKGRVGGEPAGYELGKEPDTLRLPRLPMSQNPERWVHFQIDARNPYQ